MGCSDLLAGLHEQGIGIIGNMGIGPMPPMVPIPYCDHARCLLRCTRVRSEKDGAPITAEIAPIIAIESNLIAPNVKANSHIPLDGYL
jgi:hypothetical protein